MDASAGMPVAVADSRYQPQWSIVEVTPTNGQALSPTTPNGESILLSLEHTSPIATLTVNFPANPKLGQFFEISTTGAVTTLTLNAPSGTVIMNPQQQLAVGDYGGYRYTKSGVWSRRI